MARKQDEFSYSYVIFQYRENEERCVPEPDSWPSICLNDLSQLDNVKLCRVPLEHKSIFLRRLFRFHYYSPINKIIRIPFKRIWYPLFFDEGFLEGKEKICFLFFFDYPLNYLRYLKQKFPKCILINIYTDIVKTKVHFSYYRAANIFDYWFSYDKADCEKYAMQHYYGFASKIDCTNHTPPHTDILFIGAAKNRLSTIHATYEYLADLGYKCKFIILWANNKDKLDREGICYIDSPIPYREVLSYVRSTDIILDISQLGATGQTLRFLEAFLYNKRLLTNNPTIKEYLYYTSEYIHIFQKPEDIDERFLKDKSPVNYHYNNEYSPIHLISQIDSFLSTQ